MLPARTDDSFNSTDGFLTNGCILQSVPALIGAFVGAPVLAREMETGTFRYAWTQGFGRWRWALAKLVRLAVAVTAAAGAFSVLFSWYYQPYFAAAIRPGALSELSPLSPGLFDLRGVAFAAWTLAAFAIGALAGMLIRRVVPAIVATLAAYAGLAIADRERCCASTTLRRSSTRYSNVPIPRGSSSQWWTKGGQSVSQADSIRSSRAHQFQVAGEKAGGRTARPRPGSTSSNTATRSVTDYQPASRFWPFQWIEAGWLLGLSVLLIAITVWLVRRRAT